MNMSEWMKRNSWVSQAIFTIVVAIMLYAFRQDVKASIREELMRYVSKETYIDRWQAHDREDELQFKLLQDKIDMLLKKQGLLP